MRRHANGYVPDDRYLFKLSISVPFGFQHVTHTGKKHIPRLESVDEKDLVAEFWAVSSEQQPRSTLTDIKADDIIKNKTNHATGPTSPPSISSVVVRPDGDRSRDDRVVNPNTSRDRLQKRVQDQPEDCMTTSQSQPPRPHSSMDALNQQWPVPPNHKPQNRHSAQSRLTSHRKTPSDSMLDKTGSLHARNLSDSSFRAKQPLPPVPGARLSAHASHDPFHTRVVVGANSQQRTIVCNSLPSKQFSDPRARNDVNLGVSREAWEDDIDFCYQQEAESTCNFDWRTGTPVHDATPEGSVDGGHRSSASIAHHSVPVGSRLSDGCDASSMISSTQQHRRGSSVGHRGFLAARNALLDASPKRDHSPLAPTREFKTCASPTSANVEREFFKPPFAPGYVHLPGYASNGGEYLSDMESTLSTVSRHRKSSSYGSYDSGPKSASSGSNSPRWSSTSTSSLPDLQQASRRSKLTGPKSKLGTALETLPQSPGYDTETHPTVPRSPTLPEPENHDLFLRRPETPGDRAILQHAGRVVQRGRPSTPIRFSRLAVAPIQAADGSTWI